MPSLHHRLISYFKDCYEADNRNLGIWNVFSATHEHFYCIENEESLLNRFLPRIPLPRHYAKKTIEGISHYKREKAFYYCAFMVIGKIPAAKLSAKFSNHMRKVCAPLLYFPATLIEDNDEWYAEINYQQPIINFPLLSEIQSSSENNNSDSLVKLAQQAITGVNVGKLEKWLSDLSADIDASELFRYPKLTNQEQLKQKLDNATVNQLVVLPAACLLLIKRSINSRGILYDLAKIAKSADLSAPLQQLFGQDSVPMRAGASADADNIPGILSDAQKRLLNNVANQTVSLVIGPPGTGKSYSIAAIAVDRYIKGESVLVVSQTETAVDVIHEKLVAKLNVKDSVIRAGKQDYHRRLKVYLENITSGMHRGNDILIYKWQVEQQQYTIAKLEKIFARRCAKVMRQGLFLSRFLNDTKKPGYWVKLRRYFLQRNVLKSLSLYQQLAQIRTENSKRESLLANYIDTQYQVQLESTLKKNRVQLLNFSKAIKARTSSKQEEHFTNINYDILLKAFPVWLTTLDSVHRVLPLTRELFDVVIIDEATQCDIASCLPAIYRAKRAVIVGDPKQLRFVSFLAKDKQQQLMKKHNITANTLNLDYRNTSVLDFADQSIQSQEAVTLLDEHYRSKPAIIHFSNQHFYNSALRIMTQKPDISDSVAVELVECDGTRKNGVNKQEADLVLARLQELISQAEQLPDARPTIGILSPFREQVSYLEKNLHKQISLDYLEKYSIMVSTAYGFQGQERDIMLISFCVDNNTSASAYRYMNRSDVFNVAITRAREKQILYLSVDVDSIKSDSFLAKYVLSVQTYSTQTRNKTNQIDQFQNAVCELLQQNSFRTWKNYMVAGIPMDIVVANKDKIAAIDLIGFPGELENPYHLDRYKIFERAGLRIFPLSYSAWIYQQQRFIAEFNQFML